MTWKCPKCGRTFSRQEQDHYCVKPQNIDEYIAAQDEAAEEHAKKIVERELESLRVSFEAARADGYRKYIMFLHYPPTNILEDESGFTRMAEEYRALADELGVAFADAGEWGVALIFDGVHFSPEGHAAFAEGLGRTL